MRNESDYLYYFSSEQKSEPKHAVVKYGPKHLKNHRHIRAIHLLALCYLLIAATLMSTSVSFSKYSSSSDISVQSATVASFNYDVKKLDVKDINKSDFGLSDTDVVVCAFEVSNEDVKGVSEVDLSCDVQLELQATYDINLDDYYTVIPEDQKKIDACKNLSLKMKVKDSSGSLSSPYDASAISTRFPVISTLSMVVPSYSPLNGRWNNRITFDRDSSESKRCLIYVDTSSFDYSLNTIFNFKQPSSADNLKIFVNQVN